VGQRPGAGDLENGPQQERPPGNIDAVARADIVDRL
jgi:hypothetical protein